MKLSRAPVVLAGALPRRCTIPIYEFQCYACGLRFEKLFRKVTDARTHNCTSCGAEAQKTVSAANFAFAHSPSAPVPQNTGVHSIDYNVDRVIGRDAEKRWKVVEERQRYKRGVIRDNHATGHDLSRTPDGDYRVMKPEERAASEKGRALHNEALKKIDSAKKQSGSS